MQVFLLSKIELTNSLVNNYKCIKYAGAPFCKVVQIRANKLSFLLKNKTNHQFCHSILYRPRAYNPEVENSSPVQFVIFP